MKTYLQREETLPAIQRAELRRKLDAFYKTVPDYTAFSTPSDQTNCWENIAKYIVHRCAELGPSVLPVRVLEVGAGRSGFGDWLTQRGLRQAVHWTAQDVTPQNESWLTSHADATLLGDVAIINMVGNFDIIFSTYVLEHITDPAAHLRTLQSLLRPGGSLFIFCPRYDIPGYLAPSCRHLSIFTRLRILCAVTLYRLRAILTQRAAFLIQTDLAAFHGPFFTDADAVHWVSQLDLRFWAQRAGMTVRLISLGHAQFGTKNWIIKRFLTCAVQIQKQPDAIAQH